MPIVPLNQSREPQLPPARIRIRPGPKLDALEPEVSPDELSGAEEPGYSVGYGKPPKHTQFKPGRSGNPKGRPKAARGLNSLVRDTLTQKVAVRTPGGEKRISRIEVVLQKTVEQAMKGNPRALTELIKLYGNAVPDERNDGTVQECEEDLSATDRAMLEELGRMLGDGQEPVQ